LDSGEFALGSQESETDSREPVPGSSENDLFAGENAASAEENGAFSGENDLSSPQGQPRLCGSIYMKACNIGSFLEKLRNAAALPD
jgi:hypothetical protein